MATESTKTIKTSGGDYTSLAAWEAGEQKDLVAADEIAIAECYSMSDTTTVAINGWTTDATRYIKVYTPTSERHDGKWNASKYRLEVENADGIKSTEDYVKIIGLQIYIYGTGVEAGDAILTGGAASVRELYFSHNIIRGGGGVYQAHGMIFTNMAAGSKVYVYNNLIYDVGGTAVSTAGIRCNDADVTLCAYNNTVVDIITGHGIRVSSGTVIAKNNLVANVGNKCFSGTFDGDSDYNASDDANSTGGGNDRINQTFTVVDYSNDDFHLASNDAGAKDYGTDLSADAGLAFSDDIDGETRSGSWDIGADEYITTGTAVQDLIGIGMISFPR